MAEARFEASYDLEEHEILQKAVAKGNVSKVQSLLQKFTRDEASDVLKYRPSNTAVPLVILAIRHRHEKLVRFLIDHYDVEVDRGDSIKPPKGAASATESDCTPLLESIFSSSPTILNILCKEIKDLNNLYPVHLVCQRKIHNATMKLTVLLRNGADVNIKDETGLTPLNVTCQNGNYKLSLILLQHGADVNLCSSDGNTALHHLIEHSEDLQKSSSKATLQTAGALLQHGILQTPNGKGITPLRLACLKGSKPIVQFLLDSLPVDDGQRANCYELLASSILYKHGLVSIEKKYQMQSYHLLHKAMLLRYSHDPPLRKCVKEERCVAFLSHAQTQTLDELTAIRTSSEELIKEVITARQRILDEDLYHDHLLPLLRTYYNCKVEEFRQKKDILYGRRCSLSMSRPPYVPPKRSVDGDNMLHTACREISPVYDRWLLKFSNQARGGLAELLKILHACGEDVNAQNSKGETPLHLLLWDSRLNELIKQPSSLNDVDLPEAVRVLLLAGANPNIRSIGDEETSLHIAMSGYAYFFYKIADMDNTVRSDFNMRGWNVIITLLLKCGANPNAIDCQGNSALHSLMKNMFSSNPFQDYFKTTRDYRTASCCSKDRFENRRQFFHEAVHIIQSYGGCAHTTNRYGLSAIEMCKDEDLKEKMRQDIKVTFVHFTLSGLAAAAIRKHQIKFHDKLPAKLIRIVELREIES